MYKPIESQRFFTFEKRYSQINWGSLRAVVEAHKEQLQYWYILPCRMLVSDSHFSFPVIAFTSMLVDALSQFEAGSAQSSRTLFLSYLRRHIPETAASISPPIQTSHGPISDGADALYSGIRCGILHEAHAPLYTGISEQRTLLVIEPTGFATYDNGSPCPVVSVCPRIYFETVNQLAEDYWQLLLDPTPGHNPLRTDFARKIKLSFGKSISTNPAT